MKKLYSAPIADLIEAEMDTVLTSFSIEGEDPYPLPGNDVGEAKSGDVFDAGPKSTSIFDYE